MIRWYRITNLRKVPRDITLLVGTTDPNGNCGVRVVTSSLHKHSQRLSTGLYLGWSHTGAAWTHWAYMPEPPEKPEWPKHRKTIWGDVHDFI